MFSLKLGVARLFQFSSQNKKNLKRDKAMKLPALIPLAAECRSAAVAVLVAGLAALA